jgi:hypothetical protein
MGPMQSKLSLLDEFIRPLAEGGSISLAASFHALAESKGH